MTSPHDLSSLNQLATRVLDCAFEVHRELGPGMLESLYEEALVHELTLQGISSVRQVAVPVVYKGLELSRPLILDILVDNCLILGIKATEKHNPLFEAQLLTYLRLSDRKLGYVLNFGQLRLRDGIHRIIN